MGEFVKKVKHIFLTNNPLILIILVSFMLWINNHKMKKSLIIPIFFISFPIFHSFLYFSYALYKFFYAMSWSWASTSTGSESYLLSYEKSKLLFAYVEIVASILLIFSLFFLIIWTVILIHRVSYNRKLIKDSLNAENQSWNQVILKKYSFLDTLKIWWKAIFLNRKTWISTKEYFLWEVMLSITMLCFFGYMVINLSWILGERIDQNHIFLWSCLVIILICKTWLFIKRQNDVWKQWTNRFFMLIPLYNFYYLILILFSPGISTAGNVEKKSLVTHLESGKWFRILVAILIWLPLFLRFLIFDYLALTN